MTLADHGSQFASWLSQITTSGATHIQFARTTSQGEQLVVTLDLNACEIKDEETPDFEDEEGNAEQQEHDDEPDIRVFPVFTIEISKART